MAQLLRSMAAGFLRTLASPGMVLSIGLISLVVALPAALALTAALERSIGASLVHRELRSGFDMGWYGELRAGSEGIATTFEPSVAGETAFYDNLEAWVTGRLFVGLPSLVALGIVYALLWALLLGGVLQRFARPDRARGAAGFLRGAGTFYLRFLRLALLSAALYAAVYRLHRWTYEWIEGATRDVTEEVTILLITVGVLALTALLLTLIHMSFGYAKIATVVEDRRSMLLAAFRGVAFVLRHPLRTCGLYYGMLLIALLLLALYAWVGPGIGQSSVVTVVIAFAAGQLYLLARLVVRLALVGAQLDLYQTLRR